MNRGVDSGRKWGRIWLALVSFLLPWLPGTSHGVMVWKFIAAQQYGLNVRGVYEVYSMTPAGVSGGVVSPDLHVFPNNPFHVGNYNSIYGKYVIAGSEAQANGTGAYDPINDPSVTNSFQLGPKVPLGFYPGGSAAFFRTISVIPRPEITVSDQSSRNLVSGDSVPVFTTEVGKDRMLTLQITNTGSQPLTGIVVTVVEDHEFTVTQPAATALGAGSSTSVTIRFRPIGVGTRTGFLRIASNDADENPFNLTLAGTATGAVNRSLQILDDSVQPLANGSGVQSFGSPPLQSTVLRSLTISNNGNVTVSNISVSLSGAHTGDFSVQALSSGSLAVGATMPLRISFTPTASGSRNATISVASDASPNNPYTFRITGGTPGKLTFASWIRTTELVGADAEPGATPFGDGVPNLLKYAFNLNGDGPDFRSLATGVGTAGLPLFTISQPGPNIVTRIEYLRRKNSALIYTPKRSYNLLTGSFTPIVVTQPLITSIDEEWERVVVQVVEPAATKPQGFYVVEVTSPTLGP